MLFELEGGWGRGQGVSSGKRDGSMSPSISSAASPGLAGYQLIEINYLIFFVFFQVKFIYLHIMNICLVLFFSLE